MRPRPSIDWSNLRARLEIEFRIPEEKLKGYDAIASEDLEHVFDPLFRSTRAQEQAPGTGLGLGIAREIVTAHGGTLTVTSELGHGTTVTLRLPRSVTPES